MEHPALTHGEQFCSAAWFPPGCFEGSDELLHDHFLSFAANHEDALFTAYVLYWQMSQELGMALPPLIHLRDD